MTREILDAVTSVRAWEAVDKASAYAEYLILNRTVFPCGGDFGTIESALMGLAKMAADVFANDAALALAMLPAYAQHIKGRVSEEEKKRRMETAVRASAFFIASCEKTEKEQCGADIRYRRWIRFLAIQLTTVINAAQTPECFEELIKIVITIVYSIHSRLPCFDS